MIRGEELIEIQRSSQDRLFIYFSWFKVAAAPRACVPIPEADMCIVHTESSVH